MSDKFPSIFNEVIGPIMRGCSSSHVAAGLRIGLIARDLVAGTPKASTVTFDSKEPLAASYDGQGSAMGYTGGLLGLPADSPSLDAARRIAEEQGINVRFRVDDVVTHHPNTYLVDVEGEDGVQVSMEAVSLGGGAIEIWRLLDIPVKLAGDLFVAAFLCEDIQDDAIDALDQMAVEEQAKLIRLSKQAHETGKGCLVLMESREAFSDRLIGRAEDYLSARFCAQIKPVMPVLSGAGETIPFHSVEEMLAYGEGKLSLADLAYCYEEARSGFPRERLHEMMGTVAEVMQASIRTGLEGTHYDDRILPPQAPLAKSLESCQLMQGSLQRTIAYVSALMDMKSAMGLIVAAPTGGACGALGGAVWSAVDSLGGDLDNAIEALMAAGIVGVFIARNATFAGEEGGCQAECGSGSSMAAAALVHLMGGTAQQAVDAASMALQNTLGLVCDTVGDRVEFPCLGRNVMAATNAMSSAGMAMAGYTNIIPLDDTISALDDICHRIPIELRCTGMAGLATTPSGKAIHEKLLAGEQILTIR